MDLLQETLNTQLYSPIEEIRNRPKKEFRSELVQIGFDLSEKRNMHPQLREQLRQLQLIIEDIHLASLIVDDIQDQSEWRRGAKALHKIAGLATALNAGNWLYFSALKKIFIFSEPVQNILFDIFIKGLELAHQGQALDLGRQMWDIPRQDVETYVCNSLTLKSGVLMGMAIESGLVLADPNVAIEKRQQIKSYAEEMGFILQMWDDLGNFKPILNKEFFNQRNPKHLEDLLLGRPSWIWSAASQFYQNTESYEKFCKFILAFKERDFSLVEKNIETLQLQALYDFAMNKTNACLKNFYNKVSTLAANEASKKRIITLCERIAGSYV